MTVLNVCEDKEQGTHGCEKMVNVELLSNKSGFPLEFIKDELLLEEDTIELGKLRELMLDYLQTTMGDAV